MLENLAYLQYSCVYEQNEERTNIRIRPTKSLVGLLLAVCTHVVASQSTGAAPTSQLGDSGENVSHLKERLRLAKCLPESTRSATSDGSETYDDLTSAAVRSLQRQHGLLMNGVVDEPTARAIEAGLMCYAPEDEAALKLGDQSEEVRLLQIQLNNWGFPLTRQRLEPTGTFDPATQAALKDFEKFLLLKEDGILDSLDSEILWTQKAEALVKRRSFADHVLEALATTGADAVPYLIPLLDSQEPGERGMSAMALGMLGPKAIDAVPHLTPLLTDEAEATETQIPVSGLAIEALINIDSKEAIPALVERSKISDEGSDIAAFALLSLDPSLSTILKNLNSDSLTARQGSALALGFEDPSNQKVIDALIGVVENSDENLLVRNRAAISLTMLGHEVELTNFDNSLEELYKAFYKKWQTCPRRSIDVTDNVTKFFDPVYEKCAEHGWGGLGDHIKRIFKKGKV